MIPYRIVPTSRPRLSTFMMLLLGMFAFASHVVGQKPGVVAVIDVARTGAPVSKKIYGQFLGESVEIVNSGVWSELLADRRIYYPAAMAANVTILPSAATQKPAATAALDTTNMPFMNPQLSPEERATDLVQSMTLAKKASEMQNNKGVDQLSNFEDYGMAGRTYRYFTGKPLYPFGYGLSYMKFAYGDLHLFAATITGGQPVDAEVIVTNTGKVAGDEVAQLYLKFPQVKGAPLLALCRFDRVHLMPHDFRMATELGAPIIAPRDYTVSVGGGSPIAALPR